MFDQQLFDKKSLLKKQETSLNNNLNGPEKNENRLKVAQIFSRAFTIGKEEQEILDLIGGDPAPQPYTNTNEYQSFGANINAISPTKTPEIDLGPLPEPQLTDFDIEHKRILLYEENKNRYEHELQKISLIFKSAKKLIEFHQAIGKEHKLSSSIALSYLCLAKKGKTMMDKIANSIRIHSNLFNLEDFDKWLKSVHGQGLKQVVEGNSQSYEAYWEYVVSSIKEVKWNEDDNRLIPKF